MKKLLLLALVVLGGVETVSAWDDIYLNDDTNSWGTGTGVSQKFVKVDGNTYYYNLPVSKVTSGEYRFRFYVATYDNGHAYPNTNAFDISASECSDISVGGYNSNSPSDNYFAIGQNENAKYVRICLSYNNGDGVWKWHVSAIVWTNTIETAFVNSNSWTDVYAYSYDKSDANIHMLGDWPGTKLTETDGIYVVESAYNGDSYIIFSDGKGKNLGGYQSTTFDLKNAVYNVSEEISNVTVNAGSEGYATFSSDYPLNFTGVTAVKAYVASSSSVGTVTMTQVTGNVPAKTGLFIAGAVNASVNVPTTIYTTSVGTNYLKPGTSATYGAANRYVFAKQDGDLGFYKISDTSMSYDLSGKAYLDLSGASARLSIVFNDDVNGISTLTTANESTQNCYDLQGRRVAQPMKGLYIVNGKKQIFK